MVDRPASVNKVFLCGDVGEEAFADGYGGGAAQHGESKDNQSGCPRLVREEVEATDDVDEVLHKDQVGDKDDDGVPAPPADDRNVFYPFGEKDDECCTGKATDVIEEIIVRCNGRGIENQFAGSEEVEEQRESNED